MAIRIAFSGSHRVGKSTLCRLLAEQLRADGSQVTLIGNIARDLRRCGIGVDFQSSADDYPLYVAEYVRRLLLADGDYIIHDRTLIDSMAYITVNSNAPPNFMLMMKQLVAWYVRDIDLYFYVPIEFDLIEDDIARLGGEEHRKRIDLLIRSQLTELRADFSMLTGTVNDRLRLIKNCCLGLK